mgnify:CR=1 FL=1
MKSLLKPYRGPSYRYIIKKITVNNETGDSYALNVPTVIANMFVGVEFNLFIAGSCIVFASGCKPQKTDNKYSQYSQAIFD